MGNSVTLVILDEFDILLIGRTKYVESIDEHPTPNSVIKSHISDYKYAVNVFFLWRMRPDTVFL